MTKRTRGGERVWVVLDSHGKIMNDMMGRVGFTTKKRGREVAEIWKGKLAEAIITLKSGKLKGEVN